MEKSKQGKQNAMIVCFLCLFGVLMMNSPHYAVASATDIIIDTEAGKPINLIVNKLAKLRLPKVPKRVHVVSPEIAELVYSKTQSPKWVFIKGKSIGTTQLTLWDEDNEILGSFEIIVGPNATGLKKSLYEIFPEENVSVRSSNDYLTLTGTVSDAMKLSKILKLAEAFAPGKIINLLQVGGIQQVMLEVRIAEISKTIGHRLGVNFSYSGRDGFGLSMLDNLSAANNDTLTLGTSINAVLGFLGGDPLIVAIDAMQEDGLLHILAKPTLIAQSGQDASFLAGGEFPFPVAQSLNRFSIKWKPFGIALNFTPTVLADNTISLVVSPEVSELDFTNTISYSGYIVPAIDTRRMSTVVELKDNQSFAIAGLLKNYVRESVKKFPILGDIPILGALFRSTRFNKEETELVVIVTPHLVKPIDGDELPLPTDSFEEPTPTDLLLFGFLEKWHGTSPPSEDSINFGDTGLKPVSEGDFGYIIPE